MFLEKLDKDNKKDKIKFERQIMLFGDLQALIANVNRNPKDKATPWTRKDFYNLSTDTDDKIEMVRKLTPQEVDAKLNGK